MEFLSGKISDRIRAMFDKDDKIIDPPRQSATLPKPKGIQGKTLKGRDKK